MRAADATPMNHALRLRELNRPQFHLIHPVRRKLAGSLRELQGRQRPLHFAELAERDLVQLEVALLIGHASRLSPKHCLEYRLRLDDDRYLPLLP